MRALLHSQVAEVVVVLGHEAEKARQHLAEVNTQLSRNLELGTRNVKFVVNADYRQGMFSSVLRGLDAGSPETVGFLIALADMPGVTAEVIDTLLAEFSKGEKGIVLPTYRGRRGHPMLFHRGCVDEIRRLDPRGGLRGLLGLHFDEILEVPVDCPGVVRDIDSWEDYAGLCAKDAPSAGND